MLQDNLNKWFNRNWKHYRNEVATNISKGIMSGYTDDLCIQCYEEFMKKKDEQKQQMLDEDKILNFLLYCASFQIRSGSSPFYNTYRRERKNHIPDYFAENERGGYELDDLDIDSYYGCMMEAMTEGNIGWYNCKLLTIKFLEGQSLKDISDQYGICISSLKKDIHSALDSVRDYCKHLNN